MCVFPNNIYRAHRFFSSSIENRPGEGMVDQTISRYQFKQNPITRVCFTKFSSQVYCKDFFAYSLVFFSQCNKQRMLKQKQKYIKLRRIFDSFRNI